MAKCDQGYPCDVCGKDVESLRDSDLYLRYVLGDVAPRALHSAQERHLRCNPTLSQFIVDPGFPPVFVEGPFDKRALDPADVARREERVTRGWRRLQEIDPRVTPIGDYPLDDVASGHS